MDEHNHERSSKAIRSIDTNTTLHERFQDVWRYIDKKSERFRGIYIQPADLGKSSFINQRAFMVYMTTNEDQINQLLQQIYRTNRLPMTEKDNMHSSEKKWLNAATDIDLYACITSSSHLRYMWGFDRSIYM